MKHRRKERRRNGPQGARIRRTLYRKKKKPSTSRRKKQLYCTYKDLLLNSPLQKNTLECAMVTRSRILGIDMRIYIFPPRERGNIFLRNSFGIFASRCTASLGVPEKKKSATSRNPIFFTLPAPVPHIYFFPPRKIYSWQPACGGGAGASC